MQSLHRGSFCAQDGEKPGEGSDANHDERSDGNPSRNPSRHLARSWHFSSYLRLVYHKAL